MTVIPIAMRNPNFELRTHSWVTKVLKDSDGKRVTGVAYTNLLNGEEFEQPATMVLLCAYAINNVHLMLLSGIGEPYDPAAQKGIIGKNYCYQTGTGATLFFEGKYFNPFMSAGGSNATFDDFNVNWDFDRGPHNFVGAYNVSGGFNTALPIGYRPVPSGTPQWGSEWKRATAKWYQTAMTINAAGSVMANRYNCFDLDPTYRNAFGQPLMRMTFDYKTNEHKVGTHAAQVINDIAKSMNPTKLNPASARTDPWTVVPYQSTHNTGGTIMGTDPRASALNKYLQSWDCHNLFVVGANVFPHNASYNPTGPVGALAYWTADAIKNRYLKNPAAAGARMKVQIGGTASVLVLLLIGGAYADGDVTRGEARFQDCAACHKLEAGANNVGPSLHDIFTRKAGTLDDFRYSPAMKRSGIVWTPEALDKFIADPQATVPANRMPYAGMANPSDRADLIAYLQKMTK